MPLQSLVSLVLPNHYGIFQFEAGHWKLPWEVTFLYTYCGIPVLLFAVWVVAFRKSRYAASFGMVTLCGALWMLGASTPVYRTVFRLLPETVRGSLYAEFALCVFSLGMAVLAGMGADQWLASRRRWVQAAAVGIVAADLVALSSDLPINTADEQRDPGIAYDHYDRFPQIPAEIRRLVNQNVPPWRVDSIEGYPDMLTHGGLFEYPSANGNDPLALVRLMQVRLSFAKGELWGRFYEVMDPDSPVLKLMNVRYVLSSHVLQKPGGLRKIAELPGTHIYDNPGVLPRFFLVGRIRRVSSMQEALVVLRSPGFDPGREAVVEQPVEVDSGSGGAVRVVNYGASEFMLDTDTAARGFLVTSEAAYPGWHAWIDGRRSEIVMTNAAFRGLAVPAGRHVVRMRFEPDILGRGAWVTVAAWLALAAALWFGGNTQPKADQLQSSVDIVKVIGEYVRLRKAGTARMWGCAHIK